MPQRWRRAGAACLATMVMAAAMAVSASTSAARVFGFPVLLVGLVLAFLIVQKRIDRRDPRLALAPAAVDDMVEFVPPPSWKEGP